MPTTMQQKGGSSRFFMTVCYSYCGEIWVSYQLDLACFPAFAGQRQLVTYRYTVTQVPHRKQWVAKTSTTSTAPVELQLRPLAVHFCFALYYLLSSFLISAKMFNIGLMKEVSCRNPPTPLFLPFSFSVEKPSQVCTLLQWQASDWLSPSATQASEQASEESRAQREQNIFNNRK